MNDKLTVLLSERDSLRQEIILFESSIHKAFFAAFSSLGLIVTLVEKEFFPAKLDFSMMLFFLAQTQVVLGLFILWLFSYLNLNRAYISELELTINEHCQSELNIFESVVVPRYMFSWRGTFFWLVGLFFFGYAGMISLFIDQIYRNIDLLPGVFLIVETLAVCLMTYFVFREPFRVQKYIHKYRYTSSVEKTDLTPFIGHRS